MKYILLLLIAACSTQVTMIHPIEVNITSISLGYKKDISPIIAIHCASCHNPTWVDKNWTDYETFKKNSAKVKIRIDNETMPPGNFTEMTRQERNTILKWIDQGCNE